MRCRRWRPAQPRLQHKPGGGFDNKTACRQIVTRSAALVSAMADDQMLMPAQATEAAGSLELPVDVLTRPLYPTKRKELLAKPKLTLAEKY